MTTAQGPNPPTRGYTSRQGAERVKAGIDTARRAVEMASSVLDEVTAGMDEVARRTIRVASASVGGAPRAAAGSAPAAPAAAAGAAATTTTGATGGTQRTATQQGATHQATGHSAGPELADQMLDLARQMMQLATDTAGRVLDVVAGPIERLVEPESRHDHEAWLSLGSVRRGSTATGQFDVVDDTGNGATIGLTLTNPLASMGGTIPVSAIRFHLVDPAPANPSAASDALPWHVAVPPNGAVQVEIDVRVPPDQSPGTYLGIVRASEVPEFHLVVEVTVT